MDINEAIKRIAIVLCVLLFFIVGMTSFGELVLTLTSK